MEPAAFQTWLAGGPAPTNLADAGQKLFTDLACITCHRDDSGGRGPSLEGVFGSTVKLRGGGTVTADEAYVRESITNPLAKIVEGYQPLMPTFQGLVTEEQIIHLIAYVKSLGAKPRAAGRAADRGADGADADAPEPATDRRRRRIRARARTTRWKPRSPYQRATILNEGHTLAVVAADEGPQAHRHPVPGQHHALLRHRRPVRDARSGWSC